MNELSLILPDIRSCHNVGAMFRTADACGFSKLYLCGYTATPPKVQIDKVSLGAEQWVPWEHHDHVEELLLGLKGNGVRIVGLEKTETSVPMESISYKGPMALIVGNEVTGIEDSLLTYCDDVVHIPMYGKKESLNVSVAAGIAMYHIGSKIRG